MGQEKPGAYAAWRETLGTVHDAGWMSYFFWESWESECAWVLQVGHLAILQLVVTAFLGKPILAKWGSASSAFFAGETGEVSHLREMTKIQLISSFRIMTIIAYSHEIPG